MASRLDKWVLTLIPAYGRDYTSAAAASAAWDQRKDFKLPAGPYVNINDISILKAEGFTHVNLRYAKQERNVEIEN
jgi:hypothetical protein